MRTYLHFYGLKSVNNWGYLHRYELVKNRFAPKHFNERRIVERTLNLIDIHIYEIDGEFF